MTFRDNFIQEGIVRSEIESFLRKELERLGYSGISIQKTALNNRITLYVEKPPLIIGKGGRRINELTDRIKGMFKLENLTIDIQRVDDSRLDAGVIARRIASSLEGGANPRFIVKKTIRSVMLAGAKGIEIVLSGKLIGKGGKSRMEKYSQGYMKKSGDPVKLVSTSSVQAYLKPGIIGIKVKILKPDIVFPDQIELISRQEKEDIKESANETASEVKEEAKAEDKKSETANEKEAESKESKKEDTKESEVKTEEAVKKSEGN